VERCQCERGCCVTLVALSVSESFEQLGDFQKWRDKRCLGQCVGKASSFRVVHSKRICVVDNVGSRAFTLGDRGFAVAADAAMVEGNRRVAKGTSRL
jgi:hypothetical protein